MNLRQHRQPDLVLKTENSTRHAKNYMVLETEIQVHEMFQWIYRLLAFAAGIILGAWIV